MANRVEERAMNGNSFGGQNVVVTGAGRGLGRCIASMFSRNGANVVLNGRSREPLESLEREIVETGGRCMVVQGDVSISQDWVDLLDRAVERFGRIDALVNNAGIMGSAMALHKIDDAEFDAVMTTNVRGTWLGMKHVIPRMLASGGGAIVNLSSIHGLHGNAGQAAYSASKHAVIGLTKTAAIEYARKGIRVNAVCPAAHETDMYFDFRKRFTDEEWQARIAARYPRGQVGKPEEVASVVLFLCSPGAANLHGVALPIDGGFAAQ
jgi:NAD(P)-dependent dehydrogenase (short-subunit alcohol dehydrogenase family)